MVGKDLFSVGRQCEPARLGQRGLLLIFDVLWSVRGLGFQVADTVVAAGEYAYGPGTE